MKISIIIPVYNIEQHLEECLDSVIKQTLPEKEIICINDGSTDDSLMILKRYQNRYDNIIVIDQMNMGVAKARNKGLEIANGEYAAFMDPDDYYPENDILENLYKLAKEHDVRICGGSLLMLQNEKQITEFDDFHNKLKFEENKIIQYQDYQFQYAYQRFIFQLRMIRKNDLFFPNYIRYQDPPFFVRAMICAGKFYGTAKITYAYRFGYKALSLREEIIIDVLKGFLDLLILSGRYNMAYLHANVVQDIHNNYYQYFFKGAISENKIIENIMAEINREIDRSLLMKAGSSYQHMPEFNYQEVKAQKIAINNLTMKLKSYPYVFIYGAGGVGKSVIHYLESETDVIISGVAVSIMNDNVEAINNISISQINKLEDYYEDAVFIISVLPSIQDEIMKEIVKRNIKHYLILSKMEIEFMYWHNEVG